MCEEEEEEEEEEVLPQTEDTREAMANFFSQNEKARERDVFANARGAMQ